MKDDQYEHIRTIRDEFQASQRVKDSLNNSVQALARDLYSKDTHFIFELIQNAEDNTYGAVEPSLSFRLRRSDPTGAKGSSGALVVQNNEIGFSPDNVSAICAVGKTTKRKIQGYIGEKGIGFKSVFRITSSPYIFSNGYSFSLPEHDEETGLGYIVPKWINLTPDEIDPSQTTIILPLDKPDFPYHRVEAMLHDVEPETIIFLSKIREFRVETDTGDALTVLKDDKSLPQVQIMVEGAIKGKRYSKLDEFLVYQSEFEKPPDISHEKRHAINKRDVSIAFPLGADHKETGKIFAYLPVRSDTGFPFLINADFILPSSREEILDNSWNKWLMGCVAKLIGPALALLSDNGALSVGFLEALAKKLLEITETDIFYPIALGAKQAFNDKALLPAVDGAFVKAQKARMARSSELRNLLNQERLSRLFQSDHIIKWLSAEITEGLTPNLRGYLMMQLGIEEVRSKKFVELLTHEFLKTQSDRWIIDFYSFFDDRTEFWKKPEAALRKIEIIRLEDNSHVIPFKADGTPNVYLPSFATTNFPTIKRSIFRDETAASFLKKLGIIEPDLFAEIIESILPKYAEENIAISSEENIQDIKKLKQLLDERFKGTTSSLLPKLRILSGKIGWLKNSFAELEDSFSEDELGELAPFFFKIIMPSIPILKASNGRKTEYRAGKDIYKNMSELHHYFQGYSEAWFICDDYPDEILSLIDELQINERPKISKRSPNDNGFVIIADLHGNHKRGSDGFDPDIQVDGLECAIASPTIQKSVFIWNHIALPNTDCIHGDVEKSTKKSYEGSTTESKVSEFGRMLRENAWLPAQNGGFSRPKNLFLADLPAAFRKDDQLAKSLGMKLPEIEQALDLITRGDADLKMLIEHYQSATDADRKKILKAIPREIEKEPPPSFKEGLDKLDRSQRGVIKPGNRGMSPVSNPDRYQDKLNGRVEEGIQEHSSSLRKITFSLVRDVASNSEGRRFLYEQYQGRCQTTGTTFPKARPDPKGLSENYFEACSLISYANADYLNDPGNMLCVSADTMAKLKFANFQLIDSLEDVIERFKADGEIAESVSVKIRLADEECTINWSQRHFMRLIALYDKA